MLWAYRQIHSQLGASRADIWRMAVLYTYGGFYMDIDANLQRPFSEVCNDIMNYVYGK